MPSYLNSSFRKGHFSYKMIYKNFSRNWCLVWFNESAIRNKNEIDILRNESWEGEKEREWHKLVKWSVEMDSKWWSLFYCEHEREREKKYLKEKNFFSSSRIRGMEEAVGDAWPISFVIKWFFPPSLSHSHSNTHFTIGTQTLCSHNGHSLSHDTPTHPHTCTHAAQ